MKCIYCNQETKVVNSRPKKLDHQTWRRRTCDTCHATVTTTESVALDEALRVEKRSGDIEPFYRDKLYISVYKSIDHLASPASTATYLTLNILRHLYKAKPFDPVVPSKTIAKHASTVLKHYNAAASVRYLSFQTSMPLANDVRRKLK